MITLISSSSALLSEKLRLTPPTGWSPLDQGPIALTLCPLSNLKLCVIDDLKYNPLLAMMDEAS